jgi:transposase
VDTDWLNDARKIPDEAMSYIRKIAVRAVVESKFRPATVAAMLKISLSSIYAWIERYNRGGYESLDTATAPGAEPRITSEMDKFIKEIILNETPVDYGYDTPLWTCPIVVAIVKKIFGVEVLATTIDIHLNKMGLSPQKPCYVAREQDPAEVEHFLAEKFPRIQRLAERIGAEIAFEDEAGVDMREHAGRTWGLVGQPPTVVVSGQRGKFNVLSLVTNEGTLEYEVTDERINSDKYINFLAEVLEGRDRPLIVVLDHARFHDSKAVRAFVRENRQRIRVYFLPKYAPELNPDEQVWQEIKENQLRPRPAYSKIDLRKKLQSALKSLQENTNRIVSFFQLPHTRYAAKYE